MDGDRACVRDTMEEEGSRKGGLSLVQREEQGDAVSEILGDLDGHLVRSWIVSMGDTHHDDDVFCLDKLLRNCSGVYACTVERGGSIGKSLYDKFPRPAWVCATRRSPPSALAGAGCSWSSGARCLAVGAAADSAAARRLRNTIRDRAVVPLSIIL